MTKNHEAICGRANIDAIRQMADGILGRMAMVKTHAENGSDTKDIWSRLSEDASDLSRALMLRELSLYERGVFEMAETLRSVRYLKHRRYECDMLDPMRESYRGQMLARRGQLEAQVEVMAAVFDVRKSAIHEDVTTICDAKKLLCDALEKLNEHKRRVA
ncbi:MAG: hypothetical protein IKG21_12825 [Atopobiaceae bacterium]|nr:hypothetical protein [Atopobiaceae bacterium]